MLVENLGLGITIDLLAKTLVRNYLAVGLLGIERTVGTNEVVHPSGGNELAGIGLHAVATSEET